MHNKGDDDTCAAWGDAGATNDLAPPSSQGHGVLNNFIIFNILGSGDGDDMSRMDNGYYDNNMYHTMFETKLVLMGHNDGVEVGAALQVLNGSKFRDERGRVWRLVISAVLLHT